MRPRREKRGEITRRRVFYMKLERRFGHKLCQTGRGNRLRGNLFPVWCERSRACRRMPGSVWSDDMRNRCEICRHRSKRQTQSADLPRCEKPKAKAALYVLLNVGTISRQLNSLFII